MAVTYRKVNGRYVRVTKKRKSAKKKKGSAKRKGNLFSIAARDKAFRAATKRFNQAAKKKSMAWKAAVRKAK